MSSGMQEILGTRTALQRRRPAKKLGSQSSNHVELTAASNPNEQGSRSFPRAPRKGRSPAENWILVQHDQV